TTIVGKLENLASEFPDVAAIRFTLAQLYESLDWGPEFEKTVKDLVTRFPNDEDAVTLGIDHFEAAGDTKKVDELLEHLIRLNPDSEVLVARALNQRDYQAAIKELRRLEKRRSSRKDIADRIENILITSGDKKRTFEQLKKAIEKSPED